MQNLAAAFLVSSNEFKSSGCRCVLESDTTITNDCKEKFSQKPQSSNEYGPMNRTNSLPSSQSVPLPVSTTQQFTPSIGVVSASPEWLDLSPGTVREGALTVAQLSKDFGLMLQESTKGRRSNLSDGSSLQYCCNSQCKDIKFLTLAFSVSALIFLSLLAIHCFAVQLPGIAILPLVGALVFLYLIFLQSKSITLSTAVGSLIAAICVIAFCVLILIVWTLDWKVIIDHRNHLPVNSDVSSQVTPSKVTPTIQNSSQTTLVLETTTATGLWGCPSGLHSASEPTKLSLLCLTSHSLIGAMAICASMSALGLLVVCSIVVSRLVRKNRRSDFISYKKTALLGMMQHTSPSGKSPDDRPEVNLAVNPAISV